MDLFEYMLDINKKEESPLAARMRPATIEEMVGQEHILGEGKLLRRAIKADKLSSLIFFGPPGTGKTTLAMVIANASSAKFHAINATTSGKKEMQETVEEAKSDLAALGKRTILFIDEIHRFNKAQQDYLLPFVEDGTIILIGATTENPYYEVNSALISRSAVFELKPLTKENVRTLIERAVYDTKKGMGAYNAAIDDEAADFLADISSGDARTAINAVELAVLTTEPGPDGIIRITTEVAEECVQRRNVRYDKTGDNHYDVISAFIKSMRGSDPDAAVYYLARMLYAGEDPKFIARRIMICASEDVGMADPNAIVVASAASDILEKVGMPEGRIPLAEAAVYVATAPKSNASYMALDRAMQAVKERAVDTVPHHLQNTNFAGERELGHGLGYKYAHDFPGHYAKQQYLPDELVGQVFFEPGENGYEKQIRAYMDFCKKMADMQ